MVEVTRAFCAPLPWFSTSVRIWTVASPGRTSRTRERAPLLHVNRVGLHQPDVPVNAGALVEPAVALGGVHAHQQHVPAAGGGEIGHVEAERVVAADVPADVEAVEDDRGLAVGGVEFDGDALARVGGREFEDAAIPADAGGRVGAAQRIEALAGKRRDRFGRAIRWPSREADRRPSSRCRRTAACLPGRNSPVLEKLPRKLKSCAASVAWPKWKRQPKSSSRRSRPPPGADAARGAAGAAV